MVVARSGRVDAARLLLKYGAKVNAVERWRGQTALMWAVAQKQPAMVAELVKAGADVNARSTVNNWERQVTAEPRAIYRPAGGPHATPLCRRAKAASNVRAFSSTPAPRSISPTPRRSVRC
jgi:ankyrin repeat protein